LDSQKRTKIIEAFLNDTLSSIAEAHRPNKNRKPKKLNIDVIRILKECTGIMRDLKDLAAKEMPIDDEARSIATEDLIKQAETAE